MATTTSSSIKVKARFLIVGFIAGKGIGASLILLRLGMGEQPVNDGG